MVFNNPQFLETYNAHPESAMYISACMTQEEFQSLASKDLPFNKVVLVDGQGTDVIGQLGEGESWDLEFLPKVESFEFEGSVPDAVSKVHALIKGDPLEYGMG